MITMFYTQCAKHIFYWITVVFIGRFTGWNYAINSWEVMDMVLLWIILFPIVVLYKLAKDA